MSGYDSPCCFRGLENGVGRRLLWEVTTRCNLSCAFCFRTPGVTDELTEAEVSRAIPVFRDLGVRDVIISGGEPFLLPGIVGMCMLLQNEGFDVDICTNGTLITSSVAAQVARTFKEVSVSLDSHLYTIHDRLRGRASWHLTVRGIKELLAQGATVHTISVVNAQTVGGIYECACFLNDLGVPSAAFIVQGKRATSEDLDLAWAMNQIEQARAALPEMKINTKGFPVLKDFICPAGDSILGLDAHMRLKSCILLEKTYRANEMFFRDEKGSAPDRGCFRCPGLYSSRPEAKTC